MSDEAVGARGGVPFHCPFCAETDLRPHDPEGWECRSCLRAFTVSMLGMIAPPSAAGEVDAR